MPNRTPEPIIKRISESRGGDLLQAVGFSVWQGTFDPALDLDVVMNGHISVTPLTVNRTDLEAYKALHI